MHALRYVLFLCYTSFAFAQQVPDFGYTPQIDQPAYTTGKGPLVLIDEAHHNFHTMQQRYTAFAKVLRTDGYRVEPNKVPFSKKSLANVSILVIANALHESNVTNWVLPNPSAFTKEEIQVLREWVRNGGSLFLIADHMPIAGANEALAKTFGFQFYNGFAADTTTGRPGAKRELDLFTKKAGSLAEHPITQGLTSIVTFTGQGFRVPQNATSLLTLSDKFTVFLPDTAWKFHDHTLRVAGKGLSQGAVCSFGKGRLAVFGEAAMFSAQLKGKDKIPFGLNAPEAAENLPFLRNLIHWLDPKTSI